MDTETKNEEFQTNNNINDTTDHAEVLSEIYERESRRYVRNLDSGEEVE